jgi:hypothetical protein
MIDNILTNNAKIYLSISEIRDKIQQRFGVNLKYSEIRYVLEYSECMEEYSTSIYGGSVKYIKLS